MWEKIKSKLFSKAGKIALLVLGCYILIILAGVVVVVLTTLPKPPHKGYILADSWYSCEALFQIANQLGFYYLGGIKTNRIILPKGYRPKGIQLKQFANTLSLKDLDLVTVGSERYYTYLYQGRIRGGHAHVKTAR